MKRFSLLSLILFIAVSSFTYTNKIKNGKAVLQKDVQNV